MLLNLLSSDGPPKAGQEVVEVLRHALDHELGHLGPILITKFRVMLVLSAAVVLLAGLLANKSAVVPKGILRNAFESLLLFIRDGMVRPTMGGHHGDRFVPFFSTLFVFIFACNLLGMIPIPVVGGTATSHLLVTGALAGIVLAVSLFSGLLIHKSHFPALFVPSGLPGWLVPLLFVLELAGFFIKHGVLMVRLFANMIAGHLVIGAFIGLIFLFKSWVVPGPSVLLGLFVSALELLVAFLQAYVFTLLSVLFVGGMVHPEH